MPQWLKNAIFYEIYPQSFCDSNQDGIGDIRGIISKLDYIQSMGFNALWLNPCFVSPFMDAGYDVQDYYKVAPRYGTNQDLVDLFNQCHQRGIHVLLDLVPGHTSDQNEWFLRSKSPVRNEYSDRYVWTNCVWDRPSGYSWVAGNADRDGCYMLNFFNSQPALNFGFNQITNPDWQMSYTDERVKGAFDDILNVMRFWLDLGADGFRVDMADSLVKNDEEKVATASLWRRARAMLDESYPNAALVSEWCNGRRSINMAGFHCDFILNHGGKLSELAFRHYEEGVNKSYFCKTAHVSAEGMLKLYLDDYYATRENGYLAIISGNHDTERISHYLSEQELRLAYAFILTMPGTPFMYYGDEIGMRYLPQPSKEGGFHRTGSRTPMQWNSSLANMGFSTAQKYQLYLDVDGSADAPNVHDQLQDPSSLLNWVKALNALRLQREDLQADTLLEIIVCRNDGLLVYKRGNTYVAINPTDGPLSSPIGVGNVLLQTGSFTADGNGTTLGAQTAIIFTL